MQTTYKFQQRSFRYHHTDHGFDRLLHTIQGYHLADQQIDAVSLKAAAILQGAWHVRREIAFDLGATTAAGFYLCIDMLDDFLENDIDFGPALLSVTQCMCQVFSADRAARHFREGDNFCYARVGGQFCVFLLAFSIAPFLTQC